MANRRLPAEKAKITGRDVHDPGRFKDRKPPKRTRPLGEPFAKMTGEQKEAWATFATELPWLNSSHRALVSVACILRARIEADPDIGLNALQTFSAVLSKLGATPVDETKISAASEEDEDPADAYFN